MPDDVNREMRVEKEEIIVLAGGCFWCTEAVFQEVRGVSAVQSGYSNGQAEQPTYAEVCTGRTGCAEVVRLTFDPEQVSVRELLEVFFAVHDPTQLNRQGHDVGTQYRSGIYYTSAAQKAVADALIREMTQAEMFDQPVVTEVLPLANFWPAEDVHHNYVQSNPQQPYCVYVAWPKVEKFRRTFARLRRDGAS